MVAVADWTASVRSQSATGASASRPEVPKHCAAGDHGALQPGHRRDLGHQTGLADTRVPADQHETTAARRGGRPHVLEQAELGRTADELRACRPRPPALGSAAARDPAAGPACAIKRSKALRVVASGTTPSSRSSTEAQWW